MCKKRELKRKLSGCLLRGSHGGIQPRRARVQREESWLASCRILPGRVNASRHSCVENSVNCMDAAKVQGGMDQYEAMNVSRDPLEKSLRLTSLVDGRWTSARSRAP